MSVSDRPIFAHVLRRAPLVAIGCLLLMLAACGGEKSRLEAIYKAASTSRSTGAAELRKAFYAKSITATAAIDLAHERLEKTPGPASIAFAGSVLDFVEQAEPDIDKKVLNEFYWIRIGTLAANAATAARTANDLPTARALVLAGPKRWQTEAYWRQHPNHDALASIILFESGEGDEALNRLRDRPDLSEEVQAAKDMIEQQMKKRR